MKYIHKILLSFGMALLFSMPTYALTDSSGNSVLGGKLSINVVGTGTVNGVVVTDGIEGSTPINNCSVTNSTKCSADFKKAKDGFVTVTLKATSANISWSGDVPDSCRNTNPITCDVVMDKDKTVTATFSSPSQPPTFKLTINKPTGGTITARAAASATNDIVCESTTATCEKAFPQGTPISLTAAESSGYAFQSWSPSCSTATANPKVCTVTMNEAKNITATFLATQTTSVCNSTTLSACTQDNCATLGNGVWNTTKNACEIITTPVCNSTTLSACTQNNCATLGGGTWNTTTNHCDNVVTPEKVTLTVIFPTNGKLLCDNADCVNGKQYNIGTPIEIKGVANAGYSPSVWTNNATVCGTNNPCQFTLNGNKTIGATFLPVPPTNPNPTPTCTTGQELINNVCIATGGFSKLGSPLMINGDPNTNPQTTTSAFFGKVSVDGGNPSKENLDVKINQTISVNGLIVPQHQGVADIIVVGLYVPPENLTGQTTSLNDCDPNKGDFYMNTASVDYADNYCNWVVDRNGELKSTTACNTPDTRRAALSSNVMNFWNAWGGHLNTLKPMYSNVPLDSNGVSKLLYKDTVNYTGQVCLYFGYRLTDQTLVFNGEPIIFRVSQ